MKRRSPSPARAELRAARGWALDYTCATEVAPCCFSRFGYALPVPVIDPEAIEGASKKRKLRKLLLRPLGADDERSINCTRPVPVRMGGVSWV